MANPADANKPDPNAGSGYVKQEDVEAIVARAIAERDKQHAEEVASLRAVMPVALVPANSGGPGYDDHRQSWNLAAQEIAQSGKWEDPSEPA
jgi:hypothetical protein